MLSPRVLLIALPLLVAACASGPSPVAGGRASAAAGATTSAPASTPPTPGVDLAFRSFTGGTVHLSDFKGKAVLVNAWAGWCPFCVAEMPDLERAEQALGGKAAVLFVHRTATEAQSTGESFVKQMEARGSPAFNRSHLLLDPQDSFYQAYFGFGMPVSLFLKPDGTVAGKKVGAMDRSEALQRLTEALG